MTGFITRRGTVKIQRDAEICSSPQPVAQFVPIRVIRGRNTNDAWFWCYVRGCRIVGFFNGSVARPEVSIKGSFCVQWVVNPACFTVLAKPVEDNLLLLCTERSPTLALQPLQCFSNLEVLFWQIEMIRPFKDQIRWDRKLIDSMIPVHAVGGG